MKPKCKLIGTNGNTLALASKVSNCLKQAGQKDLAEEFKKKLFECKSYDEALRLIMDYVEVE